MAKKARDLTDAQELFCQSLTQHGNASRAAREAGYNESYAYQLLRLPHIEARLSQLKQEIVDSHFVRRQHIIDRLLDIIDADPSQLLDIERGDLKDNVPANHWRLVSKVNIRRGRDSGVSIEFESRVAAIKELIDLLGLRPSQGKADDESESKKLVDTYAEHLASIRERVINEAGDAG